MNYSITALTDDYYEGTNCLINRFNIKNEEQLAKIEAGITLAKTAELERNPVNTTFDFEHYKQIHRYLFEDLYEWAGSIRTVDISKKGTNFIPAENIETVASACFDRLKKIQLFQKH